MLNTVILQVQERTGRESRAVMEAAMLADHPVRVLRARIEALPDYQELLKTRVAFAVGSVEFVREAYKLAGISEPANLSYPPVLAPLLRRPLTLMLLEGALQEARRTGRACFLKPFDTKLFTGFVFRPDVPFDELDESDQEQIRVLSTVEQAAAREGSPLLVWVSPVMELLSEWRYYVRQGQILGQARYDPNGLDDAPSPNAGVVLKAAQRLQQEGLGFPLALDFCVTDKGQTALVEVNDFWALGLYGTAISSPMYLQCLRERWQMLADQGLADTAGL